MLAPFPEKVAVVDALKVLTGDWIRWFRALLLAVNGVSGEWTPIDNSGASLVFTNMTGNCTYLKVGSVVQATFRVTYPVTADGSSMSLGGLPFVPATTTASVYGGVISSTTEATAARLLVASGVATFAALSTTGTALTNATLSTDDLRGVITYVAAS